MIKPRFRLVLLLSVVAAAVFPTGCTTEFILNEARTSTASFLVGVFGTAVTETIGP